MKHHHSSIKLACLFTLAALALVQGCGDDDSNDKPDTNIPIDTGGKASGGKANSNGGKAVNTGATAGSGDSTDAGATSEGGTGATGAGPTDGGTGNEGGTGVVVPPKCTLPELGTNGCFNCPTDNETVEWLNRCVAGVKYTNDFDNATRVPLLPADGKLDFANGH
ncbi:MAG: hypothetical protein ABUL60_31150 [Myxococcales bacterium]